MKTRTLTVGLILTALTGCAGLSPPAADKMAAIPVVSYPDKPTTADYVYKLPAGKPIDMNIKADGSALTAPVSQTVSASLGHDLYLYKTWASEDGVTWQDARKLIGVKLNVALPSYETPGTGRDAPDRGPQDRAVSLRQPLTRKVRHRKTRIRNNRGFIVFLIALGLFRTAVADWNPIPSGSMRPNLLEGDVVLVDRLAYDLKLPLTNVVLADLGEPKRGDIVTFDSPKDGTRLIKRLIGLPGDTVAMRDEVLFIDGRPAAYANPEVVAAEPLPSGATTRALRLTETQGADARRVQSLANVPARNSFGPVRCRPAST